MNHLMKLLPQNWNDTLSLLLIFIIPLMWWKANLPETVNGALILAWGNIIQHYFRKTPSEKH